MFLTGALDFHSVKSYEFLQSPSVYLLHFNEDVVARLEDSFHDDNVRVLQVLQNLLLHHLCLEESLRVLKGDGLEGADLLSHVIENLHDYPEGANSEKSLDRK